VAKTSARRGGAPGGGPDPTFPFMGAEEASTVRSLAQRACAEAGVEVVIHAGHLVGLGGAEAGLRNLMTECRHAPGGRRDWPEVVNRHVQALVAVTATAHPLDGMSRDKGLSRTYLRVIAAPVPAALAPQITYARSPAAGLIETLVVDTTNALITLTDTDLSRWGAEATRTAGETNLRRAQIDAADELPMGDGVYIRLVRGGTHTASLVLVLTDLLSRLDRHREHPDGVLVGVPFRNVLAIHPLAGPEAALALTKLAGFTRLAYDNESGPVSPAAYWWRDGTMRLVCLMDEGGRTTVTDDEEFEDLLRRLAARGR